MLSKKYSNLCPPFFNPFLENRPQARQEAAAKAVLEAAKKAGSAGELLSKRDLQAIFQQALNPPKEQAAPAKVRREDRSFLAAARGADSWLERFRGLWLRGLAVVVLSIALPPQPARTHNWDILHTPRA